MIDPFLRIILESLGKKIPSPLNLNRFSDRALPSLISLTKVDVFLKRSSGS